MPVISEAFVPPAKVYAKYRSTHRHRETELSVRFSHSHVFLTWTENIKPASRLLWLAVETKSTLVFSFSHFLTLFWERERERVRGVVERERIWEYEKVWYNVILIFLTTLLLPVFSTSHFLTWVRMSGNVVHNDALEGSTIIFVIQYLIPNLVSYI